MIEINSTEKCKLCGKVGAKKQSDIFDLSDFVYCENCGAYIICDDTEIETYKLRSFLYYNSETKNIDEPEKTKIYVIGPDQLYEKYKKKYTNTHHLTSEIIENWYPKTFSEKVDLFLLKLYKRTKYMGQMFIIDSEEQSVAFFSIAKSNSDDNTVRDKHNKFFVTYLREQQFIANEGVPIEFCLAPKGYKRVDELQRNTNEGSKDVFVSMAFNNETNATREAIRNGIIRSGFSPEFIDEIIHNHQIVPEMFRLIRECRFLILEISDPNYGAYYEAGYALGLGKEVIVCCKQDVFNKEYITDEEKKYQKYLKPHFDIAQKQILVWKDYEDLVNRLSEWIKAII